VTARPRGTAWIAVALGLVVAVAYASDLLLLDYFGTLVVLQFLGGALAGIGLILALRRPHHPVGWLFLVAAAATALNDTSRAYAWRALVETPGTLPGGELALWFSRFIAPSGAAAFFFAAFVFPTGRLLSRRWVPAFVAGVGLTVAQTLTWGFTPRPIRLPFAPSAPPPGGLNELPTMSNPAGLSGPAGELLAALAPAIDVAIGPLILVTLFGVVLRFIRSSGIERLQMKWFVYAASTAIVFTVAAATLPFNSVASGVAWVLSVVFRAFVPVAVGIAILRYRLYDIDVLINRTVVYGATTAAVGATFFLGLVALQSVLRPITNGSDLAVAAATLLSFALFQPVRRVVQGAVDRRFDRSRYDAARMLDQFADRLRDEVDLDALRAHLLGSVRQTMGPSHTSLWLRKRAP
jgi:hypothetical protein